MANHRKWTRRQLLGAAAGAAGAASLIGASGCGHGGAGPAPGTGPGASKPLPGIRYRADAPTLLLVAHCDDGPFHCWHYLSRVRPLKVAVCFMALPPEGTVASFGRLGRHEARPYMQTRQKEEREALARVGLEPIFLSGLDMPYRGEQVPNIGSLAMELARAVPEASRLVAPLGVGIRLRIGTTTYSHVDHKLARDIADSFPGIPRTYYAEIYALSKGSSDYRELLEQMRAYAHWPLARFALTPDELRAKKDALACYRSQLPLLLPDVPDILSDGALGTELYWSPS